MKKRWNYDRNSSCITIIYGFVFWVQLTIMMLQLMYMWSGYSINNSTYYSFIGMCMWFPLILVTFIVLNEENQYVIPSVSSSCISHQTRIIFIMLLPLSNHLFLWTAIFLFFHSKICDYFLSFMSTIFQEAVKRQNWFTWVYRSICHTVLSFVFRADDCVREVGLWQPEHYEAVL